MKIGDKVYVYPLNEYGTIKADNDDGTIDVQLNDGGPPVVVPTGDCTTAGEGEGATPPQP